MNKMKKKIKERIGRTIGDGCKLKWDDQRRPYRGGKGGSHADLVKNILGRRNSQWCKGPEVGV